MNQKLPYYMAYPMPLAYDDDRVERMDLEYLKSMYPDVPKRLLPYVEEECDRMECENSMMYDEYPDKLQLRLMCSRICENIRKNEKILYGSGYDEAAEAQAKDDVPAGERREKHGRGERWLRDLVEVMLYQELYKRRSDRRRRRRRFY